MSIAIVHPGEEFATDCREVWQPVTWRGLELTVLFDGGWAQSIHSAATGDDVTASLMPQDQSAIYTLARNTAAKEFLEAA